MPLAPGVLRRCMLVCCLGLLATGCAAARITPVGHLSLLDSPLTAIALAPHGGLFADLVGFELSARGYTIFDTGGTLALLLLMHKSAAELRTPEVMQALADRGINAVLTVEAVQGKDGVPDTIQVRLQSTSLAAELGGIDWHNRWGRRSPVLAAGEIAAGLVKQFCLSSGNAQNHRNGEAAANSGQ